MAKKIRLLTRLMKLLIADAKNKKGIKFDLRTIGQPSDDAFGTGLFDNPQAIPLDCGTTACAMGLAAISGAFKKEGLSYKVSEWNHRISTVMHRREMNYDEAAVQLFGISPVEADYLFAPYTYPESKCTGAAGERYVVRRIKNVIAGKRISWGR